MKHIKSFMVFEQDKWVENAATHHNKCGLGTTKNPYTECAQPSVEYKDWWEEMTNSDKNPTLKDNYKENKKNYKEFIKNPPNGVNPKDVTFEIYLALDRDAGRFSSFNNNPEYNKYFDGQGNVIEGQEDGAQAVLKEDPWFPFYRKIFGPNKRVTIGDLYNYYSKQPNGIKSFEETVRNFYKK